MIGQLERTGCIADYTRIWWDIRVHARLGTIELRICDAVTNVDDAVAITAYFQALVKRYCEEFEAGRELARPPPDPDRREQVPRRALRPRGARDGSRHRRERARTDLASSCANARRARAARARARLERELEGIDEILSRGNGADRQLRIWNANHDIIEVVRDLAKTTEVGLSRVP